MATDSLDNVGGSHENRWGLCMKDSRSNLLAAGVLGHGLGALADGVLGEFTGQEEAHGGLDLPAGDGGPLVVVGQTGSLGGDALEDVVHERVHDGHGLAGDSGVGVNLLQHFVDVDAVRLLSALSPLLVSRTRGLRLSGLLSALARNLGWHGDVKFCIFFARGKLSARHVRNI